MIGYQLKEEDNRWSSSSQSTQDQALKKFSGDLWERGTLFLGELTDTFRFQADFPNGPHEPLPMWSPQENVEMGDVGKAPAKTGMV
jgi:hypothetical protein